MSRLLQGARRTIASLAQWAEESRMVGRELWEELHRARAARAQRTAGGRT